MEPTSSTEPAPDPNMETEQPQPPPSLGSGDTAWIPVEEWMENGTYYANDGK